MATSADDIKARLLARKAEKEAARSAASAVGTDSQPQSVPQGAEEKPPLSDGERRIETKHRVLDKLDEASKHAAAADSVSRTKGLNAEAELKAIRENGVTTTDPETV